MPRVRVLLVVCFLAGTASAQVEKTLGLLYSTKNYRAAAISPDGKSLAWVEAMRSEDKADSRNTSIFLLDLTRAGAKPRRVTAAKGPHPCAEEGLSWSPDSVNLAFFSDCAKPGQRQLYLAPAHAGSTRQVTSLTGYLQDARWSPDGSRIAVLFTENSVRAAGPLEPTTADAGLVEEKIFEQRLTLVDPTKGKARSISPTDTYVYEYDWSPDGKELVYTAAKGAGDNNWWVARLFAIDAETGETRLILKPSTQIAVPRWSPDGKAIAFIGGLMSDEGSTGGDVYTVAASGGSARDITPGRKTSPAWLAWSSGRLIMTEREDGGSAITALDPATGAAETLWRGDETILSGDGDSSISLAKDGKTAAAIRTSWQRAPEVWAGRIGDWQPKTLSESSVRPNWGEAKKIHWTNDGATVQGWLLYPKNYDAARRYPMVVSIHGGPAGAKSPSWPLPGFDFTLLSAEGYFVLFPNPRGSYGQGETFTAANVKDFGRGDLRDILAGVDEVVKTFPVDNNRIGVGGWSYGGFMTMWTVTQTNRFHAAVSGAGLSNWQSYYGENSIDEWMIPYFGASVYDDPAVYAKSSPINFIKNVTTPTLVVVGDRDGECPAPQSYEFWHALKTLGVKTQFVVYPNEGHRFHDPNHIEDLVRRTVSWFNENLKGR